MGTISNTKCIRFFRKSNERKMKKVKENMLENRSEFVSAPKNENGQINKSWNGKSKIRKIWQRSKVIVKTIFLMRVK